MSNFIRYLLTDLQNPLAGAMWAAAAGTTFGAIDVAIGLESPPAMVAAMLFGMAVASLFVVLLGGGLDRSGE